MEIKALFVFGIMIYPAIIGLMEFRLVNFKVLIIKINCQVFKTIYWNKTHFL